MTDKSVDPTEMDGASAVTAVNGQIADTLKALNESIGSDASSLVSEAEAQAQALAKTLARQDAVAHLRRMQILSETAFSVAVSKQANGDIAAGEAIMKIAQEALRDARDMVAEL